MNYPAVEQRVSIECFKFAISGGEYDRDPHASLGIPACLAQSGRNSTTSFQFSTFGGF